MASQQVPATLFYVYYSHSCIFGCIFVIFNIGQLFRISSFFCMIVTSSFEHLHIVEKILFCNMVLFGLFEHGNNRVFHPKPHSGRSANLVLSERRKKKVSFSEIRTLGSCTGVTDYTDWANLAGVD